MKLTAKQQTFVQEYLVDLNATQAAIRAGYSEKTAAEIGCENLTKPQIADAVAVAARARAKRTGIDADMVIDGLIDVWRAAVATDNLPAATRALELLGKNLGMFGVKIELTGADGGPVAMDVASTMARINARADGGPVD